jgi:hypothetical protein
MVAGDFVEDDDGMGYVDMGEEDDWGRDGDEEEEALKDVNPKKRKDEAGLSKGTYESKALPAIGQDVYHRAMCLTLQSSVIQIICSLRDFSLIFNLVFLQSQSFIDY